MEAKHYSAQETLRNGMSVTVRAIRAEDGEVLMAAFKGLDARTVYLRFFAPKPEITPGELREVTDIDFERTVALVTCLQDGEGEKIIGIGQYFVYGNGGLPVKAEVAFMVAEDYQRLGIASITLRHLAGIAQGNGVRGFYAEVLPENEAMLAVFRKSGFLVSEERTEGMIHVTLSLFRRRKDIFSAETRTDTRREK